MDIGSIIPLVLGSVLIVEGIAGDPRLWHEILPYLSRPVLIESGVVLLLLGLWLARLALNTYQHRPTEAQDKVLGQPGRLTTPLAPGNTGKVLVFGEVWDAQLAAELEQNLPENTSVKVVGRLANNPSVLKVEPLQ